MKIMVEIPDPLVQDLNRSEAELSAFVRKSTAVGLYLREEVSLGRCAEIAGLTLEEFICFLGENHISIFRYEDIRDLERDIENA